MTTEFLIRFLLEFDQILLDINRWPWNSYEILESLTNILIRLLDDHEIFKDFDQNYLQEIVDHGILTLDFKDFDQNSGVQPW
jgi:hypothetical protein